MFGSDSESEDEDLSVRMPACGVMQFHNGTEEAMFIYITSNLKMNLDLEGDELVDTILKLANRPNIFILKVDL